VEPTRIGIDVGGSGVKGGVVDVINGQLVSKRVRVKTPVPSTPELVAEAIVSIVEKIGEPGPVGIGFPAVIRDGVVSTANNIDDTWIGVNALELVSSRLGRMVVLANDADCAGLAEATFGAARGVMGTVLVMTFGTGIGSALIAHGKLMPNLELGQLELSGVRPAEQRYSAKARRREDLDWAVWGDRVNEFLLYVDSVFAPSLMVIGGGVSSKWDLFAPRLDARLQVVPAHLGNNAGIVGAALLVASG
jgi:polyphosphate glucokinase